MKKLLALILAVAICLFAVACTSDKKDNADNANLYTNVNLTALLDSFYEAIPEDERPMLMSMTLTDEDFEFFTFVPFEEGLKAAVSEPMIGSIAHSVVIVETPDANKAQEIADAMKANANPRKWICVEADVVEAATNNNLAMLLMTTADGGMKDAILSAFANVNAETVANLPEEEVFDDVIFDDEFVEDEFYDVLPEDGEGFEIPEVETEGEVVESPEVALPEDSVAVDSTVSEENVPATMPEEDINTPATMPEEVIDTPADIPEETPEAAPVETPEVNAGSIDDLYALAETLYNGIDRENMPMVGTMELTEENFEYSAFVPYKSTYLAVESMPMMGSQPHSVVIVKTQSEAEAKALAEEMKNNANPRKWICVQAKAVKSAYKGNLAILVMTSVDVMPGDEFDEAAAEEESFKLSNERADIIINNFLKA